MKKVWFVGSISILHLTITIASKTNLSLWYSKAQFVITLVKERELLIYTFNHFMTRSYRSVQFVISVLLKKVTQICILDQFMRTKSHTYKCSVFNFSFSQKLTWKCILNELVRTKIRTSAQFVLKFVLENMIWKSILNKLMITRSYRSFQFVISVVLEKVT